MAKGIIFSENMYEAVLTESKTMTRRLMKPQPDEISLFSGEDGYYKFGHRNSYLLYKLKILKPRFKIGEKIYLKEAYWKEKDTGEVMYSNPIESKRCWNKISPMFMSEKFARTFIEIVSVKAEKLQDISDFDCAREGVINDGFDADVGSSLYYIEGCGSQLYTSPQKAFANLWDSINKKNKWETNPWCFCYEFKLIK